MELEFDGYSTEGRSSLKTTFAGHVRNFILPGLSLLAYILGELKGFPRWEQIFLLLLTVFFTLFGVLYSPLKVWYLRRRDSALDRRGAAAALPSLRTLAENFNEFVDQSTSGTLHYIVWNELCQGNPISAEKIPMPEVGLWGGWCSLFRKRIAADVRSGREFLSQMMDFHFMISKYNNLCVAAIFKLLPQELKDRVTGSPKSSLNSFQQRFTMFLKDYQEFAKTVAASRPAFREVSHIFEFPKPF